MVAISPRFGRFFIRNKHVQRRDENQTHRRRSDEKQ
jgi:hypothetical protein